MSIETILKPSGVFLNISARCKREALQAIADAASPLADQPNDIVFNTILEREQLGSTAVGDGIAIPHGKIKGLKAIMGFLTKLDAPLPFDAVDEQPVDLIFTLLAPENATAAHLKALAKVSRFLHDPKTREALRGAESAEAIYAIASSDMQTNAA